MARNRPVLDEAATIGRQHGGLADMSDIDVRLMLTRWGGEVLLTQRSSRDGVDGPCWFLPGGQPAARESAASAVSRQIRDGLGLTLTESDVRQATVVYWHDARGVSRIGLFFAAVHDPSVMGDPYIGWPHERASVRWSPRALLPTPVDPVCAAAIDHARRGVTCAVLGPDGTPCETSTAIEYLVAQVIRPRSADAGSHSG